AWFGGGSRRRAVVITVVAISVAIAVFSGWETFTAVKYGQSHFLYHLGQQHTASANKLNLFWPFVALLGGVGAAIGLLGMVAWQIPARWVVAAASTFVAGLGALTLAPSEAAGAAVRAGVFGGMGCV